MGTVYIIMVTVLICIDNNNNTAITEDILYLIVIMFYQKKKKKKRSEAITTFGKFVMLHMRIAHICSIERSPNIKYFFCCIIWAALKQILTHKCRPYFESETRNNVFCIFS